MKKISDSQKKMIIYGAIVVGVFLIFWIFFYGPSRGRANRLKSRLLIAKGEIQDIEAMVDKDRPVSESINLLRKRQEELENKFPEKEEQSLRGLSDLARRFDIEVISISPQQKKIFLDKDSDQVKVSGKTCQRVYVGMKIRCSYEGLVRFIEALKEDLPAFVTVEHLEIQKYAAGSRKRLNVVLELNLFLLCS